MSETPQSTKAIDNQFAKDVSKTATKANITGVLRERTQLLPTRRTPTLGHVIT